MGLSHRRDVITRAQPLVMRPAIVVNQAGDTERMLEEIENELPARGWGLVLLLVVLFY